MPWAQVLQSHRMSRTYHKQEANLDVSKWTGPLTNFHLHILHQIESFLPESLAHLADEVRTSGV